MCIRDRLYDITPPKIKVKLSGPSQGLFVHNSSIELSLSEDMSEVKFIWDREGGSDDLNSPHSLFLDDSDLLSGEKNSVLIPGLENVLIGTSYTLSVSGIDLAGNESTIQKLENIENLWPKKTRVYIAHLEGTTIEDMLVTAKRINSASFTPMPHFPARIIKDNKVLEDWINRYSEIGVNEALLLAGGVDRPLGNLSNSMELLST